MQNFTEYFSASVSGTGNNNGIVLEPGKEYVLKSYYKLRFDGKDTYKLFFVNRVDSTGNCRAEKRGDSFTIESAYVCFSPDREKEEDKTIVTFEGKTEKRVPCGGVYESDEFSYEHKKEGYMVLTFVIKPKTRKFIPATNESMTTGRIFVDGKEKWWDNFSLRPAFIGIKREKKKTVGFWGDSITQGSRTGLDKYEAWAHRIGEAMDEDISFWNLGMGWARAYDAALGGVFTKKAAMCDEVFICFGVNDLKSGGRTAEEIICDLEKAEELLKEENENIKIHFLTVPPFNMTEFEENERRKVNEYIRTKKDFFDIALALEKDAAGNVKDEYMASEEDAHPNGTGGKAVFDAFGNWRENTKW